MKSMFYFFLVTLFFLVISSCEKNKDNTPPTISFITPNENDTLTSSQTEYTIEFVAKDDHSLLKETLMISDENGKVLTSENRNIYGSTYTYKNTFSFGGTPGQIKKLKLTVIIEDEENNLNEMSIPFFVKL
jgi:hypothetical protein